MRFSMAMTADRLLPAPLADRLRPIFDRVDAALFAADERGKAGRMSAIAFAVRVVSAVIAFVSQVLMARWMGVFEYGIFVLVWSTAIIVGNIACLGSHTSIIRYVPEYLGRNLLAELRGILLASRVFTVLSSTLVAGAGYLLITALGDRVEAYYVAPFLLGVVLIPMIALSDLLQGLARANSWAMTALAPTYLVRPVLILAGMDVAVAMGYEPTARTALVAGIIATYVTTIAQWIGVTTFADRKVPPGPRAYRFGEWARVSFPIFLVESFFFLLTNADVLMVGRFMQPGDVAVYFATVKTLALIHFVYFAVKAGVAQRYAGIAHTGDRERLRAFARETVTWTFWPSLVMALAVLALGPFMLSLFGPGFAEGYWLLFPLSAGVVARASIGPAESLLTMSGNEAACARVYAATLAVNIALSFALIPLFGLWGAAIATSSSMVFEAIALALTVWKKLGIAMTILPVHDKPESR